MSLPVLPLVRCHVASDPRHLSHRARRACPRLNTTQFPGIIGAIDLLWTPRDNHCCNTKAEQRTTVPLGLLGTLPLRFNTPSSLAAPGCARQMKDNDVDEMEVTDWLHLNADARLTKPVLKSLWGGGRGVFTFSDVAKKGTEGREDGAFGAEGGPPPICSSLRHPPTLSSCLPQTPVPCRGEGGGGYQRSCCSALF